MSKIAVVIPTIRPELMDAFDEAWQPLFLKHDVEYIVVADGDYPEVHHVKKGGKTYSKKQLDPENLVQDHYTGVVNLGYAYVSKYLPDVEYIMTFHDDETPIGDPIQDHIDALNMKVPISWFSTTIINRPTDYMRGFPYEVREEAPVMFSHGVWKGVPDYDAPTQLHADKSWQPEFYKGAIPKGVLFPLCGMNLSFRRKLLPYMYFAPVAEFTGAERMDDIYLGILLKRKMDELGWACVSGYAQVKHNRASNVYNNLIKESVGIKHNEEFWKNPKGYDNDPWFNLFRDNYEKWIGQIKEIENRHERTS